MYDDCCIICCSFQMIFSIWPNSQLCSGGLTAVHWLLDDFMLTWHGGFALHKWGLMSIFTEFHMVWTRTRAAGWTIVCWLIPLIWETEWLFLKIRATILHTQSLFTCLWELLNKAFWSVQEEQHKVWKIVFRVQQKWEKMIKSMFLSVYNHLKKKGHSFSLPLNEAYGGFALPCFYSSS